MKAELWDDVEQALDARRSPFEDRGLAARLARDPEALSAARRLMERLGALERRAETRRRSFVPALVASAAALFVALLCLRGGSDAGSSRALDVRLSVQRESYSPRLARVERETTRVIDWTTAEERP